MKPGDLVKILWSEPYIPDDVGLLVGPDDMTATHDPNYMRSLVLWEGEITSLPNMQLEVLSVSK
tara:strand:- start:365 stop:556 length:192 start_codon:yes stop_codon:yes gene_type:complete